MLQLPRPPALPRDLATLTSADPMTLTLLALGGPRRVDAARADVIRSLISSALSEAA